MLELKITSDAREHHEPLTHFCKVLLSGDEFTTLSCINIVTAVMDLNIVTLRGYITCNGMHVSY